MESLNGLEIACFADGAQLEAWLAEHHGRAPGVWVKIAKKSSGLPSVTPGEVIDVALCYGWIDGQRKACDATHYLQRITPRRRRSHWSQVNVGKVQALLAAGRMRAPGLAQVRAAQADGRWEAAYASQRDAMVPSDLAAALEADPAAGERFRGLGRTAQYSLILRLLRARTPDNRATQLRRALASLRAAHAADGAPGGAPDGRG
ncbi:YdeI/OmpD-associated family protein [Streptomyces sp. GC420]|uniref:YdeI/OmpD-associated family protein n=1 Tax=Streptomyces sp. GC420 TaxID=2697568 RepID=UPI0028BEDBCC|nr:YdeI/OmpD-associated family protein [Streptomyces sp. GC420]